MSAATHFYPEIGAGGFSHVDGTVAFYNRVRALTTPETTVLDLGAGRGRFLEDPVDYRRSLRLLRGDVARVIGLDVDPVVLGNQSLDEAHVVAPGQPFPLDAGSVDIVVSDFTFEHIAEPASLADELSRVLKPGGWICARTPNKRGYIGVGARVVPNRFHAGALRQLQPAKAAEDTFPVTYRINTRRQVRRYFPPTTFENFSFAMSSEPAYFADSSLAWHAALLFERLTPTRLAPILNIFLRKRTSLSQ